jgi:hypothetical protein
VARLGSGLHLVARHPVDPRNLHWLFKERATQAGVPVIPCTRQDAHAPACSWPSTHNPRVGMAILRHSKIAVTMDIYSHVSAASTREALKRLGKAVH